MAGSVKADPAERDRSRGFSIPEVDLKIVLLIFIPAWLIALPVYVFFRSPSIQGINTLIDATSSQRPIEPRLSGGFRAGKFIDGDSGGIDNNRLNDARTLIFKAVSEGKNPLAQLALGKLRLIEGKTDEAVKPLRAALAAMPGNAEAHNDLGACLLEQGKIEEASISLKAP